MLQGKPSLLLGDPLCFERTEIIVIPIAFEKIPHRHCEVGIESGFRCALLGPLMASCAHASTESFSLLMPTEISTSHICRAKKGGAGGKKKNKWRPTYLVVVCQHVSPGNYMETLVEKGEALGLPVSHVLALC
jgi:hypothetical protein